MKKKLDLEAGEIGRREAAVVENRRKVPALVFAFTFALSANLVLKSPVVVYPPYTELERSGLAVLPPPPPPPPPP